MQARLDEVRAAVAAGLDAALTALPDGELTDAMRYATLGGKRLRALLVMEGARLHGVSDEAALPVAVAVEALHAYSLVHDDLPAMDNDDLRRGLPTVHVQWTEALAILAGDALQALAFGLLSDPVIGSAEARVRLVADLAQAAGGAGMCWGQALDIDAETTAVPLDLADVKRLQQAKTGALFQFAATAGPRIAGADPAPLAEYARLLGLAFQIADDLLDATASPEQTGKRTQKDAEAGKATFVSLLGIDEARDKARTLLSKAEAALAPYGARADTLHDLARYVLDRER